MKIMKMRLRMESTVMKSMRKRESRRDLLVLSDRPRIKLKEIKII